ncbi:hypothetical protein RJ640_010436 [Escallonia rubra]|uniref:Retrotransposon gag domain-containing protein n=1 Tax=Escallonia rubra TaxID=112253 RepID=A0AA88RM84_9ASTE|nr:hypothetical protein RJ640_010436 [Escallonia rubra]
MVGNAQKFNRQQLDEHVSLMEAQFSDHFGAIDDQLAELKETISDIPELKSSIDQLRDEMPSMKQTLREDSYGWVRKAERYFEFNPMDANLKVNFASVHFEGQAEYWFSTYIKPRGKVYWQNFVRDLHARFAKLFKESELGEFHKLRQVGTVEQYYNKFETLRSILVNEGGRFDELYFTQSFVSGLRDEIRLEIENFDLYDLSKAIFLARKQEANLYNSWHTPRAVQKPSYTTPLPNHIPIKPQTNPSPIRPKPLLVPLISTYNPSSQPPNQKALLPTPAQPPIQKLPRTYFDERRRKGLCYWCDEMFSPSPHCKHKQVSMLIVDEDEEVSPLIYDEEVVANQPENKNDENKERVEITLLDRQESREDELGLFVFISTEGGCIWMLVGIILLKSFVCVTNVT